MSVASVNKILVQDNPLHYLKYVSKLTDTYMTVEKNLKQKRINAFRCEPLQTIKSKKEVFVDYENPQPEDSLIEGMSTVYLNIRKIEEIPISDSVYNFIFMLPEKYVGSDNPEDYIYLNLIKSESQIEIGTKHLSLLSHLSKVAPNDIVIGTGELRIDLKRDKCPLQVDFIFNDQSSVGTNIILSGYMKNKFYENIYSDFIEKNKFNTEERLKTIDPDETKEYQHLKLYFDQINPTRAEYIKQQSKLNTTYLNFFTVYALPAMFRKLMIPSHKKPVIGINLQFTSQKSLLNELGYPSRETMIKLCETSLSNKFMAFSDRMLCEDNDESDKKKYCDL